MVALCQNGWPVITSAAGIGSYTVPGTNGRVTARPGDSSVILLDWLGFWHAELEPLVWPGVWGWAVRVVRGGSDNSNHSGGDAVDGNAPRHPLGTNPAANFTAAQITRAHRRLAAYRQAAGGVEVVRWGADYTGRKDGMHGELLGSAADRRRLADAIREGRLPNGERSYLVGGAAPPPVPDGPVTPVPPSTPFPLPRTEYFGLITGPAASHGGGNAYERPYVAAVQQALGITVDGRYGQQTAGAVEGWQRARMPGTTRFGEVWWDDWSVLVNGRATPPPPAPAFDPNTLATLAYGMRNDGRVKALQRFLNAYAWRPALPLLPVTGNYLEQTAAVVKAAQAQMGIGGSDANGRTVGPRTKAELAARGARW